jgi:hypothetical protein
MVNFQGDEWLMFEMWLGDILREATSNFSSEKRAAGMAPSHVVHVARI